MELLGYVLAIGGGLWSAWCFNRMVALRQLGHNAWADIDVALKQRHDLVPNLAAAVKGYAGFEAATLEEVTRLRGAAQAAATVPARGEAEAALSAGLARFFAVVERYPDLKTGSQVQALQLQLVALEDKLQAARRYYNAVVRDQNIFLQSFPNNLLAQILAFSPMEFFQIEAEARAAPAVDIGKS